MPWFKKEAKEEEMVRHLPTNTQPNLKGPVEEGGDMLLELDFPPALTPGKDKMEKPEMSGMPKKPDMGLGKPQEKPELNHIKSLLDTGKLEDALKELEKLLGKKSPEKREAPKPFNKFDKKEEPKHDEKKEEKSEESKEEKSENKLFDKKESLWRCPGCDLGLTLE